MADDIDLATDLMLGELDEALAKIRKQNGQPGEGAKTCFECGEDMPEARQKLGFKLCVACASERERREALFAE